MIVFFHRKISYYSMSCLFGKKCSQSWCRKADFFFNFFCRETFEISQKLKALAKFSFYTKVYFRFLAIFSNLNFCSILKNTVLNPMLKNGGKTGRPEFPADRNFPPVKKKRFFQNISKSKTPNNQSLKL